MKLSDYKKLEESMKEIDFHTNFKNINRVMFVLSIFGHISSIFLAYFLVNKIIGSAVEDNPFLVGIASVILLSGLELLKREIFDKFSLQFIKVKQLFSPDVLPLFLVSIGIVSISFYASIKGAQEFSTKSKQIDTQVESNVETFGDSLRKIAKSEEREYKVELSKIKSEKELKDKELTELSANTEPNRSQMKRKQFLEKWLRDYPVGLQNIESKIDTLNQRTEKKISQYVDKTQLKAKDKKDENKDNSFFFVLISTIIELMILFGVYFNEYFKFRSFNEFKSKLDKDTNYQKWIKYNGVLELLFNDDTKVNDKLPTSKMTFDLAKVAGIPILVKEISDITKLFTSLGIIRSSGNAKYILKDKVTSLEILKKHFKID
jgi:flagellar biosynthesis chaperone FliJ